MDEHSKAGSSQPEARSSTPDAVGGPRRGRGRVGGPFDRRSRPEVEGLSDRELDTMGYYSLPPVPFLVADALWVPLAGYAWYWMHGHTIPKAGSALFVREQLVVLGCALWPVVVSWVQWIWRRRSQRRDVRWFEPWRGAMLFAEGFAVLIANDGRGGGRMLLY